MSVSTKRKYVIHELQEDMVLPEPPLFIVKIVGSRGNNLHEVSTASSEKFLASMPTKFRKNVWIKRGDYVICQPIAEGDKVKAEIVHILYRDNIRYIQQHSLWPESFETPWTASRRDTVDMLPATFSEDSDSQSDEELNEASEKGESAADAVSTSDRPFVCQNNR
ncbi:unnamed protein product [Soboliphyme baturini]|uniref:Probable RNA-binding protein EIF1AD n=1 Tax=Soboliphyme baturini TaxID=241478 RepID=A0A183IQF1_9BILA|nr:unnamed protein product [Soboliphyme baturini]